MTPEEILSMEFSGGIQPGDTFELGSAVSQSVKLSLVTKQPITEGDIIKPRIALWVERNRDGTIIHEWEWVPMGVFYIDELEESEYDRITITAYDAMIQTETLFTGKGYATLRDVATQITSQTGIAFADTIPATRVTALQEDVYSVRQVAGFIASMMGGCMVINRDGKFKVIRPLGKSVCTIDGENYFENKPDKYSFTIGKISCIVTQTDSESGESTDTTLESGTLGAGEKEIQFENPWMTQTVLNSIFEDYEGFTYIGYSIDVQGNPAIDPGDLVTLSNVHSVQYDLYALSYTYTYNGGVRMELSASSPTEQKNQFSSKGDLSKELEVVKAQQGIFNQIVTETIDAHSGKFDELEAQVGNFEELYVSHGEFDTVLADSGTFGKLEADVGEIDNLISTTILGNLAQLGHVTTDMIVAGTSLIGDALVGNLSAGHITSGILNTNFVQIQGENGRMKIMDNTIQMSDANRVRLQLGLDATDGYSFVIWDASGKVMFDATGVTENGIGNEVIRDDMVAPDANIDGGKINIQSLISEINGSTTKLSSSSIIMDGSSQTLSASFNTLTTNVGTVQSTANAVKNDLETQKKTISSHTTSISAIQGQIQTLIGHTQIVEGGETLYLEDVYSKITQTETSLSSQIGGVKSELTTNINAKGKTFITDSQVDYPEPPYSVGDIWLSKYNTGYEDMSASGYEINVCKVSRAASATGQKTDWALGSSEESIPTGYYTESSISRINQTMDEITLSVSRVEASKSKVFTSTPTPPYQVGDLWVRGSAGSIMRCQTARTSGSYVSSDWVAADNTATRINSVEQKITPDGIFTTINDALGTGNYGISTTKFVMDSKGLEIQGGGLSIKNNQGGRVLYADTNGNLVSKSMTADDMTTNNMTANNATLNEVMITGGTMITFAPNYQDQSIKNKAIEISGSAIYIYSLLGTSGYNLGGKVFWWNGGSMDGLGIWGSPNDGVVVIGAGSNERLAQVQVTQNTTRITNLVQSSSESIKSDIEAPDVVAMDIVATSNIYRYHLKCEKEVLGKKAPWNYGFIIERKAPKEVISSSGDSVSLYSMAAINWQATKEIITEIESLKQQIAELKGANA